MPPSSVKIVDNRKSYDDLRKQVFAAKKVELEFGVFGERGGTSKKGLLTLAEIAAVHEFGSPSIGVPERSFLRAFVDEYQNDLREFMRRLLEQVVEGKYKPEQALELFGAKVVGLVKVRIAKGIAPELKPATKAFKARKGKPKDTPLIYSGQLRNSITYRASVRDHVTDFPAAEDAELTGEQRKAKANEAKKAERKAVRAEAAEKRKAERKAVRATERSAKKTARDKAKASKKRATEKARAKAKASKARAKKIKNVTKSVKRAVKDRVKAVKTVLKAARTVKQSKPRAPRPKKGGR